MRHASAIGGSRLMMGGVGLECKCRVCGKAYMKTPEYVYKDCCSWTCYRAFEKEDGRRSRKNLEKDEAKALEKIKKCEERIAHYKKAAEEAKAGTAARNTAQKCAREWMWKMEDAQMMLDEVRSKMHG